MKLEFTDFYGQYVTVHNQTGSGNTRIVVRTLKDLCAVKITPPEKCDIETDISLDFKQLKLLHSVLSTLIAEEEDDG